jgi:glycosyltransferase involved in cell wall biosynthesis
LIPDPYDDEVFRLLPEIERKRDLIFVGRFVSDKGLPVLLEALVSLAVSGLKPTLTVIGDGPEKQAWRRMVDELALSRQVRFAGIKRGAALAEALNAHRVMVVPSLWNEPFGVVALEGMSCGCVVVGSEGGGLKQAIGPAGLTFANGDVTGLAAAIGRALSDPAVQERCRAAAPAHLALHRPATVAKRYLEVFEQAAA